MNLAWCPGCACFGLDVGMDGLARIQESFADNVCLGEKAAAVLLYIFDIMRLPDRQARAKKLLPPQLKGASEHAVNLDDSQWLYQIRSSRVRLFSLDQCIIFGSSSLSDFAFGADHRHLTTASVDSPLSLQLFLLSSSRVISLKRYALKFIFLCPEIYSVSINTD